MVNLHLHILNLDNFSKSTLSKGGQNFICNAKKGVSIHVVKDLASIKAMVSTLFVTADTIHRK